MATPEVLSAKARIDAKSQGTESFSVTLTPAIKAYVLEHMGLELSAATSAPMRWIKGDTRAHVDTGAHPFELTYLAYLTDSTGELMVDGHSYPMSQGCGYAFSEGLRHETVGTGSEPRLLLGPMSETGSAVGISPIQGPGGSTIYLRHTGADIEYSNDNQASWNAMPVGNWPYQVNNTSTGDGVLRIVFTTSIELTGSNQYFDIGTEKIQFGSETLLTNGQRPTINITNVANYSGFLRNGDSGGNGNANITVYNLVVSPAGTSSLTNGDGWMARAYYGKGGAGNYFVNCLSMGDTPGSGIGTGALIGAYAAYGPGAELVMRGCSSSGSLGQLDGGIVGSYAGASGGSVTCDQCWSTGAIGGAGAGGIFGEHAGDIGTAVATKCYSTGAIGDSAGGIFGGFAGDNGSAVATKCYSRGTIGVAAGGIFGRYAGSSSGVTAATNCYSAGTSGPGRGIWGSSKQNGTDTNCYAAGGTWSSTAAAAALDGAPPSAVSTGTTWLSLGVDQPYELVAMGYTPYSLTAVNAATSALIQSASQSVVAGSPSQESVSPDGSGNAFAILKKEGGDAGSYATISIDVQTGQISTSSSTVAGTYTLTVYSTGSYNVTTFDLTVTTGGGGGGGAAAGITCCQRPVDMTRANYGMRAQITAGNVMIGSTAPQRHPISYAQLIAMKMAYACKR